MNHKIDQKPPRSGKWGRVFLGGSLVLNAVQATENDSLKTKLEEAETKLEEERAKNSKLSDEKSKLSDQNFKLFWDNITLKKAETRATAALNQITEAKDKEIERLKAELMAQKTVQPDSPMKTS